MNGEAGQPSLTDEQLARWSSIQPTTALDEIHAHFGDDQRAIGALTDAALARAGEMPQSARTWLQLAASVADEPPVATMAAIDYARARVAVTSGDPIEAESFLRRAQSGWGAAGDTDALGRSYLGLTQILAVQGRYGEAEEAADSAVELLERPSTAEELLLFVRALRNLATLQLYRERHTASLATFGRARTAIAAGVDDQLLHAELAHIDLNEAGALTFLDRVSEATAALEAAIQGFGDLGDLIDRGRARSNLGRLHLRTGRYVDALRQFELAARDLLGDVYAERLEEADEGDLRLADELLLEWSLAYVTLNLLPEAERTLQRAETLFRASQQPYELGQTRYTQGLLFVRQARFLECEDALTDALNLFTELGNAYWRNRTLLGMADLALHQARPVAAQNRLADVAAGMATAAGEGEEGEPAVALDMSMQAGILLLSARADLALGHPDAAADAMARLAALLDGVESLLPHLALQLAHVRGQIARAHGNSEVALTHFAAAVDLLDGLHSAFPLEELRAAYLLDKEEIYSDILLAHLDVGRPLEQVFAVVERTRSRSLLERLLADAEEWPSQDDTKRVLVEDARRRLHWLYNRLQGEEGTRRGFGELSGELQRTEALLQRLETSVDLSERNAPRSLPQVDLSAFQAELGPDHAAVIFMVAGAEVLAMIVTAHGANLVRGIAGADSLEALLADLRFQMGRVETRSARPEQSRRLLRRVQESLAHLYTSLVAPLEPLLTATKITWIPYGSLHQVPFHALWDGEDYLLQRFECRYAPSATVAFIAARDRRNDAKLGCFVGLAPDDPTIPAAQREVMAVASRFADGRLYLGNEASRCALVAAAAEADVLHLATHGLFRPDNPYFSALKLADGWVDVRELYRLPLRAQLVVLSACESGAASRLGGDELVGLARGFMGAGATSLVVSQWNVHDESAAVLMDRFYAHLTSGAGKLSPAAALARAQRESIEQGRHPYYWAAFRALGV